MSAGYLEAPVIDRLERYMQPWMTANRPDSDLRADRNKDRPTGDADSLAMSVLGKVQEEKLYVAMTESAKRVAAIHVVKSEGKLILQSVVSVRDLEQISRHDLSRIAADISRIRKVTAVRHTTVSVTNDIFASPRLTFALSGLSGVVAAIFAMFGVVQPAIAFLVGSVSLFLLGLTKVVVDYAIVRGLPK
jgi:hypothetical protein